MAVEDFANGANILQQVDVSQIFKSLAMGIAEAQQELDDNSISQLQRLSETELAGKSLLELGFVPAFYSFTYADISASIHLRMAEKTSFELGVKANFDYESSSASESDFSDLSKEHQFFSEKEEYKSNRKFSMKSSSTSSIKVNDQYYSFDQQEGCISKIEKMHDQLLQDDKIERVNIQRSNEYTTVYKTLDTYTILRLANYTTGVTGGVTVSTDFQTTFNTAPTTAIGFFGDQLYRSGVPSVTLQLFFDFDKEEINFGYDQTVLPAVANKDVIFEALATILRMDPTLKIMIDGYTDGSGEDIYNENLSKRRCSSMRKWFHCRGVPLNQLDMKGHGETLAPTEDPDEDYRKVKITLLGGRGYIFFITDLSGVSPTTTSSVNYFIESTTSELIITNEGAEDFEASSSYTTLDDFKSTHNLEYFHVEEREDVLYLLNKSTEITFMTYSANSESIEIVAEEGSEEEIRVYNSENSMERIKNIATKNNSDRRFAAGASVDIRIARQFEMSIEGSASMSARMVAVPPPAQFLTHIEATFITPPTP